MLLGESVGCHFPCPFLKLEKTNPLYTRKHLFFHSFHKISTIKYITRETATEIWPRTNAISSKIMTEKKTNKNKKITF